ncbi:MAG: energy-coupling factor ABC transporter permease [Actinomycetota bacterium]|nr:MAG: Co2+ ABC transporter permease-like [Actinomycetota bacterium]MDO8950512.1 energy-coupling factor ABC transporter permease [Actinomycetota bacterium]MDP3631500.1 energy-coupling factor ABC transporter permease [Actinomycetota bacterium]
MSHIHIPDGVLPVWLWLGGWVVAAAIVWLASARSGGVDVRRKVPLVGVMAALMLVAMSSEIVPIAYHINLTVVAGVLLGPQLSIVAAFVVQVVLALLGHGGVTVIGLNTLMTASEMLFGWMLFRGLITVLGPRRVGLASGVATVVTLALATTMLVGLVAVSGVGAATVRETGALDPQNLTFAAPFSDSIFSVGLFSGGERSSSPAVPVRRFATIVYTLGPLGWLIEALVTAAVLSYIARVRPSLIFEGALTPARQALPGDEHGRH